MNFPVVAADEFSNLLFALHHHRQGGRLDTAHGGQKEAAIARVEGGHGAGTVDADQPVGLRSAAGGIGQALHLGVAAQMVKAIANGLRRHGLQPQALHRLAQGFGPASVLLDQSENQLPFASRVAGVDQCVHVFALGLLDHRVQTGLGFVDRLQIKERRDHRQIGKAPFAAFDIELLRRLNLHQVAYSAGHDIGITLKMIVMFLKFARNGRERPNDVLSHRRLLRNHQCFHLSTIQSLACAQVRARPRARTHARAHMLSP